MTETLARNKRRLTREDILPLADYAAMRKDQRKRITEIKRRRRVEVGPFARPRSRTNSPPTIR
jgi:uncharacterized protein DUF3501